MRIVVFGPARRVGVMGESRVVDLGSAANSKGTDTAMFASLGALIEAGDRGLDAARRLADEFHQSDDPRVTTAIGDADLRAPFPGQRFALAGSNNADHVANAFRNRGHDLTADQVRTRTREKLPDGFWVLGEPVGPDADVLIPSSADGLFDYEGEVAVVLGKGGKRIQAENWLDHVWGVTLVIDWCVRPEKLADARRPFYGHKIFDTSKSLGPWIEVDDVEATHCQVTTTVNGVRRQDFNTSEMIHSYAELLEQVSRDFTMHAGDLLAGGTGPGTAADSTVMTEGDPTPRDLYLKPGDTVTVSAPGLGDLTGNVIAEKA